MQRFPRREKGKCQFALNRLRLSLAVAARNTTGPAAFVLGLGGCFGFEKDACLVIDLQTAAEPCRGKKATEKVECLSELTLKSLGAIEDYRPTGLVSPQVAHGRGFCCVASSCVTQQVHTAAPSIW